MLWLRSAEVEVGHDCMYIVDNFRMICFYVSNCSILMSYF